MKDVVAHLIRNNGCLRVEGKVGDESAAVTKTKEREKPREKDEANLQRQFLDSASTVDSFDSSTGSEFHSADKQLKELESQLRENARKRRDIDAQSKGAGRKGMKL